MCLQVEDRQSQTLCPFFRSFSQTISRQVLRAQPFPLVDVIAAAYASYPLAINGKHNWCIPRFRLFRLFVLGQVQRSYHKACRSKRILFHLHPASRMRRISCPLPQQNLLAQWKMNGNFSGDYILSATHRFIDIDLTLSTFSDRSEDYEIGSPIGFGASSIVYTAEYHPASENGLTDKLSKGVPCALKVLDLDSLPVRSLQLLQRETTLMSLSKHPNVLRVRGSWMSGHKLYIALRLMNKGSAADVMRYGWPGGMEEDVVRCILAQALKGLKYVIQPTIWLPF